MNPLKAFEHRRSTRRIRTFAWTVNVLLLLYYIVVTQGVLARPDSFYATPIAIFHVLILGLILFCHYNIDRLTKRREAFDRHPGRPDGKL